ncbi:two-component system, OmpR family, phosphate regulon sensor histidine kinase PhoR [Tranquillimonas rosea]|uniref:histidine kinase n=1 Tax=Tranquillimonas rosea TaxID=641238 RepID=A0A1H9PA84_9RHOB|nr:ATP-binding protein [Tranquillimonas rosea]SER45108.1 two-component system, OmpR family, phosphate regulon sensor histidine kinase PhoR [Tranquillimonas rosea]
MDLTDLGTVLTGLSRPALAISNDERIAAANEPARALFGPNLVGRHYITALRQPSILDCVEQVLKRRTRRGTAQYLLTDRGRDTTWDAAAALVSLGEAEGVLLSFEDVTPMHEAGQMRRDFVANVSHELRTPLTALLGFIETLKGAAKDDAVARDRFLSIMEKEATRMNRLVSDLLSLSRVEADERLRPTDRLDLAALIRSVQSVLASMAEDRGAQIVLEGFDEPIGIPGDSDQLKQVFTNLVENALKYGPAGGTVTVHARVDPRDPALRGPAVRVSVIDEGEGIDALHIPRLTERFYRVDSHRSREMGGTGLGLAIVKHIVNRHRGRLRVDSTLGEGSAFRVVLPMGDAFP